jgi:hypothetical protein
LGTEAQGNAPNADDGRKKTGPKAGFLASDRRITGRERERGQQPEQQRQPEQQQRQQPEQQRRREQRRQPEQQLREPEQQALQQQELRREQQPLPFDRRRSWTGRAEQPGERSISFDFP